MITRRKIVIVLGAGVLAPYCSFAQQQPAKIPRVGFLSPASAAGSASFVEELRAGLRDLGYVENKNIFIDFRWADGKYDHLSELAAELLQLKVDVIVASTPPAVQAAKRATTAIPIVMVATADPVGAGFVASLSRPGGNITGLSSVITDLSSKYLELLRVAVPKLSRVAVMVNPSHPDHPLILKNILAAAKTTGVIVSPFHASTVGEIAANVGAMMREHAGALIVLPDSLFRNQARQIAELAIKNRLPTMFWTRELAETGGLMSYGQNNAEHHRRAAIYVDKILKGAKPADLPVEQAMTLDLVINRKTAKAIGVDINNELLLRANKVIE